MTLRASTAAAALGIAQTEPIAANDGEGSLLTTFDGRRLNFGFSVDPVIDLSRLAVAGHRIEPRLCEAETLRPLTLGERTALLAADMERVDLATVELGLSHLEARRALGDNPSLILALSFTTASSQRARSKLVQRPISERELLRGSVIWLLTDVPDGAPTSRLIEVTAMLRPFCRAVFAQLRASEAAMKSAQAAGLAGLMLEPRQPNLNETDAALWLLQVGKLAERTAPALIAGNLRSETLFPMALAAGFTHATLCTPTGQGAG